VVNQTSEAFVATIHEFYLLLPFRSQVHFSQNSGVPKVSENIMLVRYMAGLTDRRKAIRLVSIIIQHIILQGGSSGRVTRTGQTVAFPRTDLPAYNMLSAYRLPKAQTVPLEQTQWSAAKHCIC